MGLNAIYPARCLGCGGLVEEDFGLCGRCWRDTGFIGGVVCDACGAPLPGAEGIDTPHCDGCMRHPPPWSRGRAAIRYADTGRRLVLALKHGDRLEIARPAGRWMAQAVQPLLHDQTLIAPVPLHWQRMIKRRYNQSALLARWLAQQVERDVCPDLLQRVRRTRTLDGMSREARAQVLEGAIRAHPKRRHRMAGRPVLLVDDVLTTGATLAACARACHDAGSGPVCVVALARAGKDA